MKKEIWKDIKGYEGLYQVSNLGNIRGLDRYVEDINKIQFIKGKQLKPLNNGTGYYEVHLRKDKIRKKRYIHRLVCEAFLNNYSENLVVNHKDFDRSNNSLKNLEMVTTKENVRYSQKFNRYNRLFDRKDKEVVINKLKELNFKGMTKTEIRSKFKVSEQSLKKNIPELKNYWNNGKRFDGRKVKCIDTGEVFNSIASANEKYGITTIKDCCRGRQKTAAGFKWEYVM